MNEQHEQAQQSDTAEPASGPQTAPDRCPHCGVPAETVWVHGHGQCANCGINRAPCCDGGSCG